MAFYLASYRVSRLFVSIVLFCLWASVCGQRGRNAESHLDGSQISLLSYGRHLSFYPGYRNHNERITITGVEEGAHLASDSFLVEFEVESGVNSNVRCIIVHNERDPIYRSEPCTSPLNMAQQLTEDGSYTLDISGTRTRTGARVHARVHWIMDRQPPQTRIDRVHVVGRDSLQFVFSAEDSWDGSTFECSVDALEFTPCTSPRIVEVPHDGEHQIRIRAIDRAGNVDSSPAYHAWTTPIANAPSTPSHSVQDPFGVFSSNDDDDDDSYYVHQSGGETKVDISSDDDDDGDSDGGLSTPLVVIIVVGGIAFIVIAAGSLWCARRVCLRIRLNQVERLTS